MARVFDPTTGTMIDVPLTGSPVPAPMYQGGGFLGQYNTLGGQPSMGYQRSFLGINPMQGDSMSQLGFLDLENRRLASEQRLGNLNLGINALNAGAGIFGAYTGFQQMRTAQDALDFQKEAFRTNLANQRQLTNNQLREREAFRQQFLGNYNSQAVDDYVRNYGI